MTADTDDAKRARAFELGALGTLLKPLAPLTLSSDIAALLESANNVIESTSGKRKVVIAFSAVEKHRLLKKEIVKRASSEKLIMLALGKGEDSCDEELRRLVSEEKLIYLQIQPSLVAKLPYLHDLSPVMSDLRGFLEGESGPFGLIFDDAHLVLHLEEGEAAIARAHALKEALTREYEDILFAFSRDGVRDPALLNKLAQVLVR
jgi:hypothetical protein